MPNPDSLDTFLRSLNQRVRTLETRRITPFPDIPDPNAGSTPDFDCTVDHDLTENDTDAHLYMSFDDALDNEDGHEGSLRVYLRSMAAAESETVLLPTTLRHLYIRGRRETATLSTTQLQMDNLTFEGGSISGTSVDIDGVSVDSFEVDASGTLASRVVVTCRLTNCLAYGGNAGTSLSLGGGGTVELIHSFFLGGVTGGATTTLVQMSNCYIQGSGGSWRGSSEGSVVANNKFTTSSVTLTSPSVSTINYAMFIGNSASGNLTLTAGKCGTCQFIGNSARGLLTLSGSLNAINTGGSTFTNPAAAIVDGNSGTGLVCSIGSVDSFDLPHPGNITFTNNSDGIVEPNSPTTGTSSVDLAGASGVVKGNRLRGSGGIVTTPFIFIFSHSLVIEGNVFETGPITAASDPGSAVYVMRVGQIPLLGNHASRCRCVIAENVIRWYVAAAGGVFHSNWTGINLTAQILRLMYHHNFIEAGTEYISTITDTTPLIANNRLDTTSI